MKERKNILIFYSLFLFRSLEKGPGKGMDTKTIKKNIKKPPGVSERMYLQFLGVLKQ